MPLSVEQQQVCADVNDNNCNVIVSAVPGSGKSTLQLDVVKNRSTKSIIVTYNKALCAETNKRILAWGDDFEKKKVQAFTYHGLLSSITGKTVSNDTQMSKVLAMDHSELGLASSKWPMNDFETLVIDECQDQRGLYFKCIKFLLCYVALRPSDIQVVLMGDVDQLLYDFFSRGNADTRFLLKADTMLNINQKQWVRRNLTQTFRLTPEMADFVNAFSSSTEPDIVSSKPRLLSVPVEVIVCDVYRDAKTFVYDIIKDEVPEDVLILCNSLNTRSPAIGVVNELVKRKIPVHVARSGDLADTSPANNVLSFTANRVQVKTYHGAKGLEAPVVIVLNNRALFGQQPLERSMYVALTRASRKLVVFQNRTYVTMRQLKDYCKNVAHKPSVNVIVKRTPASKLPKPKDEEEVPTMLFVDSLFSFIDVDTLMSLQSSLDIDALVPSIDEAEEEDADEEWKEKKEDGEDNNDSLNVSQDLSILSTSYSRFMVIKTKCNDVDYAVNVLNIAGTALEYALQYYVTNSLPAGVTKVIMSTSGQDADTKHIRALLHNAVDEICKPRVAGDTDMTHAQRCLKPFAAIASCVDGLNGYTEKISLLHSFDFMVSYAVFSRFEQLVSNLDFIIGRYPTITKRNLRFGKRYKSLIRYVNSSSSSNNDDETEEVPISIFATPSITCDQFSVHIIHKPNTVGEDLLQAVATAEVVGVKDVYVVNIYTGELQQVQLDASKFSEFMLTAIRAKVDKEAKKCDREFVKSFSVQNKDVVEAHKEMGALYAMMSGDNDDDGDGDDDDDDDDDDDVDDKIDDDEVMQLQIEAEAICAEVTKKYLGEEEDDDMLLMPL